MSFNLKNIDEERKKKGVVGTFSMMGLGVRCSSSDQMSLDYEYIGEYKDIDYLESLILNVEKIDKNLKDFYLQGISYQDDYHKSGVVKLILTYGNYGDKDYAIIFRIYYRDNQEKNNITNFVIDIDQKLSNESEERNKILIEERRNKQNLTPSRERNLSPRDFKNLSPRDIPNLSADDILEFFPQ